MTDVAALIKILTAPTSALPQALQVTATIPISLLVTPDKLLTASRPVQISLATPDLAQLLTGANPVIKSAAGDIQLVLPPNLSPEQKQQLTIAAQQQKSVTLVVIPSTSPQAYVIVADQAKAIKPPLPQPPKVTKPAQTTAPSTPASTPLYQAIVLPDAPSASPIPLPTLSRELAPRLVPGTEIRLSLQPLPPDAPAPAALKPNESIAIAASKTVKDQLVLALGDKTVLLPQPPDLPLGSRLVATIYTILAPREATQPAPLNLPDIVQQIVTVVREAQPALVPQLLQKLPQPNAALPTTLLLFLQAVQQGNLPSFLGEPILAALRNAGRGDLVQRLQEEASKSEVRFIDQAVGEWRSLPFPIFVHNQCHPLALFVHQDRNSSHTETDQRGASRTRFLINFSLSYFGAMQLDGLAQPKQLDLVIRHEHDLPAALPDELRANYLTTLDAIGFRGSLKFQPSAQGWVMLREASQNRSESLA